MSTHESTAADSQQHSKHPEEAQERAREQYVDDFMHHVSSVATQNATLRARAPTRIKEATTVAHAAGLKGDGSDDADAHYHVVQRMLDERAFYPPHDKRKESTAYAAVHKQMTVKEDQPCLACGVRYSTLHDPKQNPFGAVQMETHHHTIEWALANAIRADLFNARVRPGLLARATQRKTRGDTDPIYEEFDPLYAHDMTPQQIKDWVDHSPDNLWVLCDVHHRHKFVGIHAITYPIWGPQDLVDATIVQEEIDLLTKKIAKGGASTASHTSRRPA